MPKGKKKAKKGKSLKETIEEDLISKLKENLQESFFSYQKQDQMMQQYNKMESKDDLAGKTFEEKMDIERESLLLTNLKRMLI